MSTRNVKNAKSLEETQKYLRKIFAEYTKYWDEQKYYDYFLLDEPLDKEAPLDVKIVLKDYTKERS